MFNCSLKPEGPEKKAGRGGILHAVPLTQTGDERAGKNQKGLLGINERED